MTTRGSRDSQFTAKRNPVIPGKRSATRNPGRGLCYPAEVNALDSRYALRAHSVRRGNDDNSIFLDSPFTAKTSPVIPGKRQRDPESSRALGALAGVDALDSRRRGNDDNGVSFGNRLIAETSPVIPGKRSATRNPVGRSGPLPGLMLWIPASAGMTGVGCL